MLIVKISILDLSLIKGENWIVLSFLESLPNRISIRIMKNINDIKPNQI